MAARGVISLEFSLPVFCETWSCPNRSLSLSDADCRFSDHFSVSTLVPHSFCALPFLPSPPIDFSPATFFLWPIAPSIIRLLPTSIQGVFSCCFSSTHLVFDQVGTLFTGYDAIPAGEVRDCLNFFLTHCPLASLPLWVPQPFPQLSLPPRCEIPAPFESTWFSP